VIVHGVVGQLLVAKVKGDGHELLKPLFFLCGRTARPTRRDLDLLRGPCLSSSSDRLRHKLAESDAVLRERVAAAIARANGGGGS
jgi:hypothetical protein